MGRGRVTPNADTSGQGGGWVQHTADVCMRPGTDRQIQGTHNDDPDDANTANQRSSDAARADAPATECIPVVHNLFYWLQSAFV